jgi:hypothetical protein
MWKRRVIAVVLLVLTPLTAVRALARSPASMPTGEQESIEQLQARAAAAKGSDQVKLYMQLADRQLLAADDSFNRGDFEKGKSSVDEVAGACEKAGAAARSSGKHLKATEIHVRDVERRVEAISRSLSFEDRDALKGAIDRLEKVRSDLLFTMFGASS